MRAIIFCLLFFATPSVQADSFFVGIPLSKITVSEQGIEEAGISGIDALEYKVVIELIGEDFVWATRNNLRLIPVVSGAYTTFIAENGSGYIRVLDEQMREIGDKLPESQRGYYYMEHLIHQMGSITYLGR